MPREIEPPTIQKDFILAALGEGKRTDGRALLQTRDVGFTFGSELGWVECRLGKTKYVFCHVLQKSKAEIIGSLPRYMPTWSNLGMIDHTKDSY